MTEAHPPPPPSQDVPQPTTPPVSVRVGTDVQEIDSIEALIRRHGRTYLDRTFTAQEVRACGGYNAEPLLLAPGLATRFCAKEATLKVLRPVAIMPEWIEIEIVSEAGGWLGLQLSGAAGQIADERGLVDLQVSMSYAGSVAIATVVAIGAPRSGTA